MLRKRSKNKKMDLEIRTTPTIITDLRQSTDESSLRQILIDRFNAIFHFQFTFDESIPSNSIFQRYDYKRMILHLPLRISL